MEPDIDDRVIFLGDGLPAIPERLLLAHARGEVLFICGAGISMPAGLPDFRELVLGVYQKLDKAVHGVIVGLPHDVCNQWEDSCSGLTERQAAEVRRFVIGDHDVVLGMLERRLDDETQGDSSVRREVVTLLRAGGNKPAAMHRALMRLADRGGAVTIVTTNFDLLLEMAGKRLQSPVETYSLGSIPRPTKRTDFAGVLHIHGVLNTNPHRVSELVLSDQDFGEFYMRRRVVPDFIYDTARLFHLVLVGYSANDPPMRYLLNAVAADGTRFDDLKERFIFFGASPRDPVALEDWKARGITPIHYDSKDDHAVLGETFERWAELSAINGKTRTVDKEIRRIVKATKADALEADHDLFDHLLRRSNASERIRLSALVSGEKADLGWLDAIVKIGAEKGAGAQFMIPPWATLDDNGRAMSRATVAFLKHRLAESDTIVWALRLNSEQNIERIAVTHLLNSPNGPVLEEPWASAWRLIEESWSRNLDGEDPSMVDIYNIQQRLHAGDRSGAILSAIVNLVAPGLKVQPIDPYYKWQFLKKPRRPSHPSHLLSASLTSGELVDLNILRLAELTEVPFLMALANALEAAVNHGLDIARRISGDGEPELWRLGSLHWVGYTQAAPEVDGENEPNAYNPGIAPAVKFLHAVVARIAELEPRSARPFVQRWRFVSSPVHIRLGAAAALNPLLASAEEVAKFLIGLNDRQFWGLHEFPEIAKLRALRFAELDRETQRAITARLRKRPPRDHWLRKSDADQVKNARLYWAVRELKRIEIAGGDLPRDARLWLEAGIGQFADLAEMKIDDGFPGAPQVSAVPRYLDDRYDALQGDARLRTLEKALSTERGGWDDDSATRASNWLRQSDKTVLVLGDLEAVEDGGDKFPSVWNRFSWVHAPGQPESEVDSQRDLQDEAERVLRLLEKPSDKTLSAPIEGISQWLYVWRKQIIDSPQVLRVWLRIWPIAVEATNVNQQSEDDAGELMDYDTLNTPSGQLVGVFLSACRENVPTPFVAGSIARQIRDAVISATGWSGLIALHRLIEFLPYFLRADCDWTREHLIPPLLTEDAASLVLWHAVALRRRFADVLKIIGDKMAEKATDQRLGRRTRQSLASSLVVESLHAFRESREPEVPNPRIQQMLRSLDDEVRATAADAIQQFVQDLSKTKVNKQAAAELFQSAAVPFLNQVWPQERSLTTPGVSRALADLPATSGEAFAEAVEVIERFLVPFGCRSMRNYGLYGNDGEAKKLSIINDEPKAKALLRLLDLTVGPSEDTVMPHGLTDALDQIRSVAPALVGSPVFRRLSTAARR